MKINYPTWEIQSYPTPNNTLWICDKCGYAVWAMYNTSDRNPLVHSKCKSRMRRATEAETKIGKEQLIEIIGGEA